MRVTGHRATIRVLQSEKHTLAMFEGPPNQRTSLFQLTEGEATRWNCSSADIKAQVKSKLSIRSGEVRMFTCLFSVSSVIVLIRPQQSWVSSMLFQPPSLSISQPVEPYQLPAVYPGRSCPPRLLITAATVVALLFILRNYQREYGISSPGLQNKSSLCLSGVTCPTSPALGGSKRDRIHLLQVRNRVLCVTGTDYETTATFYEETRFEMLSLSQ